MIDNIELIKPLMVFPKEGDSFYYIQILQRKKDNPDIRMGGSSNNSRLIKGYYVDNLIYLETHYLEMQKLANVFNARVCITLNPRSFRKTAFQLMNKVSNQMLNEDYYNVRKAYDSVCGMYQVELDKRWILDIDTKDKKKVIEIEHFVNKQHKLILNKNYEILAILETKNGYHIITNPFNLMAFTAEYPQVEVHKNNPTLLYMP